MSTAEDFVRFGYALLIAMVTLFMWYPRLRNASIFIRTIFSSLVILFFCWWGFNKFLKEASVLVAASFFVAGWWLDRIVMSSATRYEADFSKALGLSGGQIPIWLLIIFQACFFIGIMYW